MNRHHSYVCLDAVNHNYVCIAIVEGTFGALCADRHAGCNGPPVLLTVWDVVSKLLVDVRDLVSTEFGCGVCYACLVSTCLYVSNTVTVQNERAVSCVYII